MEDAGRLRHWLTFQKPGPLDIDSDGAQVETWVDAFDVNTRMPCDVVALSGYQLVAAQAIHSKVTTKLKTRYRPGFDAKMRAVGSDETIYDILAVVPDPNSRIGWSNLLCSSGVNDG